MPEETKFRLIRHKGNVYLRKEDVVAYILDIALTEEMDVKDRLESAAKNISQVN